MTFTLLFSVFLGALVSGWHCALMCGGFATGIERVSPLIEGRRLRRGLLLTHAGRLTTYALLGALCGALGQLFWRQSWLPLQRGLFALAGAVLIWQALWLWRQGGSHFGQRAGQAAARGWARLISPLQRQAASAGGFLRTRFLLGCAWGLVPCGLIYGVLPLAMLAGDAPSGAAVMLAFGLGTLPNLLLLSGLSARLAQWGHARWARHLAAALMLLTGALALYRAASLPDALLQGGLCHTL